MSHATADIRNIALLGQAASGKTLLTEALLFKGGAIRAMGELSRGTTVCDHDPLEKEYQHSLDSAICHLDHQGKRINLIDTPGYPDLLGRSLSVLPAVETAAIVINAQSGIEISTRRVMDAAVKRGLDRVVIVNKIDLNVPGLPEIVEQLRAAFGAECLPINLPAEGGKKVVDCFFSREGAATDFSSVAEAHQKIIEQVVEVDEPLLERYLGGEEVPEEALHDAFEKALREGHLVPICFTSATTGAGVAELLDLIARLMPNPTEANPPAFVKGEGDDVEPVQVSCDPGKHVLAHVFKVSLDPYVGRIAMMRVHQGTLRTGAQLFVGDARKAFKAAHVFAVQGKTMQEVSAVVPGDLCAITKVDDLVYDAVVHDSHDEDHHHLRRQPGAPPMLGLAITPARHGDEQKLADAMHKLLAEDSSLRLEHVPALNETVLYGMGDLHLKVLIERMKRVHNVEVKTHVPSVPFRETITRAADGHHRHKKQTGGAGQFGEVFLRVKPLPRGSGFEFDDDTVGGSIPAQLMSAVEKGVRQVLDGGAIAGFPLQDVRVEVYDGKTHPVDSKEVAFVSAGKKAFLDAITKAHAIVLEPIVNLTITAPANSIGSITADVIGMRGAIKDQSVLPGNLAVIEARAPLSEVRDYHQKLKAHTAGEGVYTMEFSHYEPAAPRVQQELVGRHAKRQQQVEVE
ncbi:MAG TPA: elongation factor G [Nevskiaceae bacterium]|nr:elongation factor G [Nevskiaceae bacterium]